MVRPQLRVATAVKLEAAGEHDLFAPANNDVPEAMTAPEGEQEPFTIVPEIEEVMPVSTMVSSRGRTSQQPNERKHSTGLDFSINYGL